MKYLLESYSTKNYNFVAREVGRTISTYRYSEDTENEYGDKIKSSDTNWETSYQFNDEKTLKEEVARDLDLGSMQGIEVYYDPRSINGLYVRFALDNNGNTPSKKYMEELYYKGKKPIYVHEVAYEVTIVTPAIEKLMVKIFPQTDE